MGTKMVKYFFSLNFFFLLQNKTNSKNQHHFPYYYPKHLLMNFSSVLFNLKVIDNHTFLMDEK